MFGRVPAQFSKHHWIHLEFKSCVEVINRIKLDTLKSSDCSQFWNLTNEWIGSLIGLSTNFPWTNFR